MINSENPDLVLSVGDYVSGHSKNMSMPIEDIAKELGKNCVPEIIVIDFE